MKQTWQQKWERLTDTRTCPNSLYGRNGTYSVVDWLKDHETLYAEEPYGEPMLDLDEKKVKQFIENLLQADHQALREKIQELRRYAMRGKEYGEGFWKALELMDELLEEK